MKDLNVSVFQTCSSDSVQSNQDKILKLLKETEGRDFCLFPENSLYINIEPSSEAPKISLESGFFKAVKGLCLKKKMVVHFGGVPLYKKGKLFNSSIVIFENGDLKVVYDKIHMFKAQFRDLNVDESKAYSSGKTPAVIEVKGWKIGLSICFDLRFAELYLDYAKKGCDAVVVPSAFFKVTGRAHWEVLLRARAIESQFYVLAAGQTGVHKSIKSEAIRKSYGHSMVVDPWGEVLFDLKQEESVCKAVLKKSELEKVRKSVLMERRL